MYWLAVIGGAFVGFWTPVIIAAISGTERIGLVVLLTLLTGISGVMLFMALYAAFILPRRERPRHIGSHS